MTVPTKTQPTKNLWVAAGDGDLNRVQELIEQQGIVHRTMKFMGGSDGDAFELPAISPNAPDPYTYTAMHAAASYGQLHVLEYLVSHGGNVNVTDEDGDTPLYTVENVDTARWLVEHGATVYRANNEGVSPIDHLSEEFPQVASYLRTVSSTGLTTTGAPSEAIPQPSQYQQNIASEELTSSLMQSVQDIMQRAGVEGRDPEAELREVVGRTVLEGVLTGYEMTTDGDGGAAGAQKDGREDVNGAKKPRTDWS